jgi:hypothetical protein
MTTTFPAAPETPEAAPQEVTPAAPEVTPEAARVRRWPLFLIAAPAAVAVWSGWVGLGELAGFGVIHPLPGIADGIRLNTAITLPVGVEAYGAYALGAWLTPGVPEAARAFARRSAIGSLILGMCGQVIYHLLAAGHATRAPWTVTMFVSCLPVVALGFGAALAHLLKAAPRPIPAPVPVPAPWPPWQLPEIAHEPAPVPEPLPALPEAAPDADSEPAPEVTEAAAPEAAPKRSPVSQGKQPGPATPERLRDHYAADLAAGQVPSKRQIRREWPVGYERASELHDHLAALAPS